MTIVLKSNNVAKAAITDKHGLRVAQDWKVMLDFENNRFLEKSASGMLSKSITDLISATNENPFVYTKDGEYVIIENNTPRLSLNRNGTVFGLLEEATMMNYYAPSEAPVSKTINLPRGSTGPWVVKMVGTGSVKVTSSAMTKSTSEVFTELQPGYFTLNSPSAVASVTIEIIGKVKHLSIIGSEYGSNGYLDNTLIRNQYATWYFGSGVTKVRREKVAEHLLNKQNFSIVFQCIDNDYLNFSFDGTVYKPLVELINQSKHISIIKRKIGSAAPEEIAIRLFNNTEVVIPLTGTQKVSTIAISSGDNGLMFAVNGNVTNPSQVMKDFTVADILIGSSNQWLSSISTKAQGVFTKFVMYDRQLNSDELRLVTQSFQ